ncbi:hypothetical protein ACOMHN_050099 [Nucella lapillus]
MGTFSKGSYSPEHGGWSPYTVQEEGACSLPCGGGHQTITYQRTCTDPAPFNGGRPCEGEAEKQEETACNTHHCPVDGGWSAFDVDSLAPCSKSCGTGIQELQWKRTCTHPAPQYGAAPVLETPPGHTPSPATPTPAPISSHSLCDR